VADAITSARRTPGAWLVLGCLVAGFAAGAMVQSTDSPAARAVVAAVAPIGTLWVNAIRMTVVPLVVSLLIAGVTANAGSRVLAPLGARAVLVFLVMLVAGGTLSAVVSPLVLARLSIAPGVAEALRANAATGADSTATAVAGLPSIAQRVIEWVPANPVRSAVDGAMLPLIVFTVCFALALARVAPAAREPVLRLAQGTSDAMLVIVGWVLRAAPIGIFALAFSLAARTGLGAAGALVWLVALQGAVCLAYTALLYPAVALFGRTSPLRFAAAAAPAQAVALGARSSLAALPALIDGARDRLALPPVITSFALPFAVATLRPNVPITWVVCVSFLGALYGVPVAGVALVSLVVTAVLASFSVPGIPSGSLFILAPVLVSFGMPAEAVGLLIAVDAIPDMFKTLANVTSHMASAVLVSRVGVASGATESVATQSLA
jgi:proton glutamate symport protein